MLRPARWWQAPLPALARVAAAILLFAGGAALANLDVRYDKDGFAVRTGWRRAGGGRRPIRRAWRRPRRRAVATAPRRRGRADAPWRMEMAALERSLRDEFHQQLAAARRGRAAGPVAVSASADAGEARLMNQVHALIDDSYRRQQVEMAYQIRQVEHELQTQRRGRPRPRVSSRSASSMGRRSTRRAAADAELHPAEPGDAEEVGRGRGMRSDVAEALQGNRRRLFGF